MSRQLPSQPNLRHLKNEAKEFRKALGRGDAGIAERLAANLPRLSDATSDQIQAAEVSLQEVQHVLAKEYGSPIGPSWQLRRSHPRFRPVWRPLADPWSNSPTTQYGRSATASAG